MAGVVIASVDSDSVEEGAVPAPLWAASLPTPDATATTTAAECCEAKEGGCHCDVPPSGLEEWGEKMSKSLCAAPAPACAS